MLLLRWCLRWWSTLTSRLGWSDLQLFCFKNHSTLISRWTSERRRAGPRWWPRRTRDTMPSSGSCCSIRTPTPTPGTSKVRQGTNNDCSSDWQWLFFRLTTTTLQTDNNLFSDCQWLRQWAFFKLSMIALLTDNDYSSYCQWLKQWLFFRLSMITL